VQLPQDRRALLPFALQMMRVPFRAEAAPAPPPAQNALPRRRRTAPRSLKRRYIGIAALTLAFGACTKQ
jgi:hypothetical protein